MKHRGFLICLLVLSSCTAEIDPETIQPRAGAPVSSYVERVVLPRDPALPIYALVVQTFVSDGPVSEFRTRVQQDSDWRRQESKNSGTNTSQTTKASDRDSNNASWSGSHNMAPAEAPPVPVKAEAEPASSISSAANSQVQPVEESARPDPGVRGSNSGVSSGQGETERSGTENRKSTARSTDKSDGSSRTVTTSETTMRTTEVARRDINVSAQFTSSLAAVGNFVVLDPNAAREEGAGRWSASLAPGRVGPFIIKAIITEEVDEVEMERSRYHVPLIARGKDRLTRGVVVLDISILDGRTGELVSAFPVEGTYTSQHKKVSSGLVLTMAEQEAFARSVVEQAQRPALNEAARRILAELSAKYH